MKQKRIKLQALLIVLFIATSLLAIMVGLIQRYIWMNNHMLNSTLEFSKSLTYQLDFSLEYIFTNRINLLQKVAQEVTLAGQTTPQAYRIIKSALQRNSDLTGIGVASSSGTFVLFAHANTAQEKAMIGINISNRDYFSRVMQQKKPVIGEWVIAKGLNIPTVPIVIPIMNNSTVQALLIAGLDMSILKHLIPAKKINTFYHVVLLDYKNKNIYASNHQLDDIPKSEYDHLCKFIESPEGFIEVNLAGSNRFIYYKKGNYGYTIAVCRTRESITQEVMSSYKYAILWGGIAIALAALVGYILSHVIATPFIHIASTMESIIQKKQFNVICAVDGVIIDEMYRAGKTFNEMIQKLHEVYSNLE